MNDYLDLDFKLPPEDQITAAALNPVDRIGWPDRTGNRYLVFGR